MHAAAALLLAIQCLNGDYSRVDTKIERKTDYALVRIPKPDLRGTRYRRAGEVVVYSANKLEEDTEGTPLRMLRLYVDRGGEWWQLQDKGGPPVAEDRMRQPASPVVVEQVAEVVAVTYTDRSFHGSTAKTVLLDFRPARPRVTLAVECSDVTGRGICMGPSAAREPYQHLTCDTRLRCTSTETQWIDWATRATTRTFDLLTGEAFPPKLFSTVTYSSGAAYARAFAADRAVLTQRVVIDRIGPVTPVFELSRNSILFAGPSREPQVSARFFHLTPGTWREIPLTLLTDEGYPAKIDAPSALDKEHTPYAPQLQFSAWNIEYAGKGRLVEVLAREGEARSLYWVMFDPNGRTGAIRLAVDTPEFRHCDDQLYPPSVTRLEIPGRGLPAYVDVIRSWRMTDLDRKTLPQHCGRTGQLGWSPSKGWQPVLFDPPCTKGSARPYTTTLDDDGTIGWQMVEPRS